MRLHFEHCFEITQTLEESFRQLKEHFPKLEEGYLQLENKTIYINIE